MSPECYVQKNCFSRNVLKKKKIDKHLIAISPGDDAVENGACLARHSLFTLP